MTLQDAYKADTDGGDAIITTDTTDGAVVIAGDQNFVYSATGNVIVDTDTLFVNSSTNRVGIGDATPAAALTVGSGDLFQVTASGAIAAATGLTTTGNVDLTGATMLGGTPLVFEGATADAFKALLSVTDPTADRTITLQDGSGVLAFTSDIVLTLAGLSDTNIASPLGANLLVFDGTDWVNRVMSGAGTLSSTGALTLAADSVGSTQLASSGVTAGTYGSSTQVPVITIDADGRVTSASTTTVNTSPSHFGGDGSDGALNVSSGTTTIDLQGKRYVVKNYSSLNITGTATLAFINPHAEGTRVVLRVQGDATISSGAPAIDLRGMGGQGGAGAPSSMAGASYGFGPRPGGGAFPGQGGGSAGGAYPNELNYLFPIATDNAVVQMNRTTNVITGAGGGGGGASASDYDGGNGGTGAGAMFLEVGGTYTFSGTIDASGQAGFDAQDLGGGSAGGGGGGGGSGGHLLVIYNVLGSDTGTYIVVGGLGGQGTTGTLVNQAATGYVIVAANPSDGATLTIGSTVYTFYISTPPPSGPGVQISNPPEATANNLSVAINNYPDPAVSAAVDPIDKKKVQLTALVAGSVGNSISLSTTSQAVQLSGPTLTGGGTATTGGAGGGGAGAVLNAGANGQSPFESTGGDGGVGADGAIIRMLNNIF